jgi:hypothetical protein
MHRHRVQSVFKFMLLLILGLGAVVFLRTVVFPHLSLPGLHSLAQFLPATGATPTTSATGQASVPPQPLPTPAPVASAPPESVPEALPAPTAAPALPPPVSAHIRATVMVAGSRHEVGAGRIALPSGTRFQLQITSDLAGTMELHGQTPEGGGEPIWRGDVSANAPVESPVLRLAGKRGLETLYLVLHVPSQGIVGRQRVQIWHL